MNIELHLSRYGNIRIDQYTSLHEAIDDAWGAVEFNMAMPVKLIVDGQVIAQGHAISRVRDDDEGLDPRLGDAELLQMLRDSENARQLQDQMREAIQPAIPRGPRPMNGSRWA